MSLRAALLLVVGAVLLAWLPSLDAAFQFDDLYVIVADARVQSLDAWAHSLPAIRPLLRLSYALNHAFGDAPAGFRLVNILVHAASAALVLLLLESLGRRLGLDGTRARHAALLAALLFALHPAQTEAVTYVSGRSSSLSALLALGSLYTWSRSFEGSAPHGRRALAFALAIAAVGVKESALALPLAMLLWALVPPTGRPDAAGIDAGASSLRQRQLRSALAIAAVLAVAGMGLLALTPYGALVRAGLARRGPWTNLLAETRALPWLLGQVLAPWQLAADPDLRVPARADWTALATLFALAMALAGAAWQARRWPAAAFGLLWFALWLLPTNLLLPRDDLANDRQLYLPLVGPAWLAGWWLFGSGVRWRPRGRVAAALAAALLVALAALTLAHNRLYATEVGFWEAAAQASPGKSRVLNNLGYAYARACRDDDARAAFGQALADDPDDLRPRVNLKLLALGTLLDEPQRHCAASTAPH